MFCSVVSVSFLGFLKSVIAVCCHVFLACSAGVFSGNVCWCY